MSVIVIIVAFRFLAWREASYAYSQLGILPLRSAMSLVEFVSNQTSCCIYHALIMII